MPWKANLHRLACPVITMGRMAAPRQAYSYPHCLLMAGNRPISLSKAAIQREEAGTAGIRQISTRGDARERRLSGRPVTNSRSTAVNIEALAIFVTFAAAALVCVVLGAHRHVVLGLRGDRAAPRPLVGATHSRTMM